MFFTALVYLETLLRRYLRNSINKLGLRLVTSSLRASTCLAWWMLEQRIFILQRISWSTPSMGLGTWILTWLWLGKPGRDTLRISVSWLMNGDWLCIRANPVLPWIRLSSCRTTRKVTLFLDKCIKKKGPLKRSDPGQRFVCDPV